MELREAKQKDLPAIITLLADDKLGKTREGMSDLDAYQSAFAEIDKDPNAILLVGEEGGAVVATCQLTIIPSLTFKGSTRGQIEGVRVAATHRGAGTGRLMIERAIEIAKARGCRIVQLTTNKARPSAIKFYEGLGFEATHEGMKLYF